MNASCHVFHMLNRLTASNLLRVPRIIPPESIQHSDFNLAGISILLYCTDDLDGTVSSCLAVVALNHFAKRALPQLPHYFVYARQGMKMFCMMPFCYLLP